jgi:hypothetical protein
MGAARIFRNVLTPPRRSWEAVNDKQFLLKSADHNGVLDTLSWVG